MIKKLRKNKKGFTLVELIVVLIILAILAAILIPSLTGYIDRANNRAVLAETRSVVLAAQTIASETYAVDGAAGSDSLDEDDAAFMTELLGLSEVSGSIKSVTISGGVVTYVLYENVRFCEYNPGAAGNTDGDYNVSASDPS